MTRSARCTREGSLAGLLAVLATFGCGAGGAGSPNGISSQAGRAPSERTAVLPASYTEAREACAHRDPARRAFFGELHVHTRLSFDANLWDVRGTPDDAYRFARGEVIDFPTEHGRVRRSRLERPLDFAAVTDHAQFMGAVDLCTTKGSDVYGSVRCGIFRGEIPPPDPTAPLARLQGLLVPTDVLGDFRRAPEPPTVL